MRIDMVSVESQLLPPASVSSPRHCFWSRSRYHISVSCSDDQASRHS
jgi:hypothetical protein